MQKDEFCKAIYLERMLVLTTLLADMHYTPKHTSCVIFCLSHDAFPPLTHMAPHGRRHLFLARSHVGDGAGHFLASEPLPDMSCAYEPLLPSHLSGAGAGCGGRKAGGGGCGTGGRHC